MALAPAGWGRGCHTQWLILSPCAEGFLCRGIRKALDLMKAGEGVAYVLMHSGLDLLIPEGKWGF